MPTPQVCRRRRRPIIVRMNSPRSRSTHPAPMGPGRPPPPRPGSQAPAPTNMPRTSPQHSIAPSPPGKRTTDRAHSATKSDQLVPRKYWYAPRATGGGGGGGGGGGKARAHVWAPPGPRAAGETVRAQCGRCAVGLWAGGGGRCMCDGVVTGRRRAATLAEGAHAATDTGRSGWARTGRGTRARREERGRHDAHGRETVGGARSRRRCDSRAAPHAQGTAQVAAVAACALVCAPWMAQRWTRRRSYKLARQALNGFWSGPDAD